MNESDWQRYSVAQGVLVHNNKVLLVANDYGAGGILWSLPGGRLEPGESHLTAIMREFKEETGLDIIPQEFIYSQDSISQKVKRQFITLVFRVELANSEIEPMPVWDNDVAVKEVRFVSFEEAASLLKRTMGEALLHYLNYGAEKMPRRYWHYPEYLAEDIDER
jgi:8-oxo-dGTP diphosphatase